MVFEESQHQRETKAGRKEETENCLGVENKYGDTEEKITEDRINEGRQSFPEEPVECEYLQ